MVFKDYPLGISKSLQQWMMMMVGKGLSPKYIVHHCLPIITGHGTPPSFPLFLGSGCYMTDRIAAKRVSPGAQAQGPWGPAHQFRASDAGQFSAEGPSIHSAWRSKHQRGPVHELVFSRTHLWPDMTHGDCLFLLIPLAPPQLIGIYGSPMCRVWVY